MRNGTFTTRSKLSDLIACLYAWIMSSSAIPCFRALARIAGINIVPRQRVNGHEEAFASNVCGNHQNVTQLYRCGIRVVV